MCPVLHAARSRAKVLARNVGHVQHVSCPAFSDQSLLVSPCGTRDHPCASSCGNQIEPEVSKERSNLRGPGRALLRVARCVAFGAPMCLGRTAPRFRAPSLGPCDIFRAGSCFFWIFLSQSESSKSDLLGASVRTTQTSPETSRSVSVR